MTRISGYRQIACPNCLARYRIPKYGSINFTSFERWSDGRRVGSLFDNGGGIRACRCGKYYRLHTAIDMGLLAVPETKEIEVDENGDEIYEIPAFLLRPAGESRPLAEVIQESSLFKRIKSFFSRSEQYAKTIKRTRRVIVHTPMKDESLKHIPHAIWAADEVMHVIINAKDQYDEEMVLTARERYRMYLNDKYREPFKAYCVDRSLPIPSYEISTPHKENTEEILQAYLAKDSKDWRNIGDLYREAGDFVKARECLSRVDVSEGSEADLEKLIRACSMEISNPLPM